MDKETLSNYGWIVIAVLVLVVMIALATPFGSFVSEAVQSTTKGLFDVNKSALDSTGLINIDNQEFDVPDMNHGAGENGGTPVEPEEPATQSKLSGTWKFNDELTRPSFAYLEPDEEDCIFSIEFDIDIYDNGPVHCTAIRALYWRGQPDVFDIEVYNPDGEKDTIYNSNGLYYMPEYWCCENAKTITFTAEQQVPDEFYNWFIANATQIG